MTLVITLLDPNDKVEQYRDKESGADERWTNQIVKITRIFGLDQGDTTLVAVQTPQESQDCNTSIDRAEHLDRT